jgi:hypothetical protein
MPRPSKFVVNLVYYWLLDRVADPPGLRHYVNTAPSLKYLKRHILLSREYRGRHLISKQIAIESLFEKLLRRRPDPQSLDRWMRDLGEREVPDTAVWTTVVDDFMNLEQCARFLRLFDIKYDA